MYIAGPPLEPTTPSAAGRSVDARDRATAPATRAGGGGERAFPGERVTVSGAARAGVAGAASGASGGAASAGGASGRDDAAGAGEDARSGGPGSATGREGVPGVRGADRLDARDQALVAQLASRDAHVRAHEAAHQAAGGGLTGGASYTYQLGPDGKECAIGGEVPIRAGGGTTPDERIAEAQRVRAAALAPADPSPQDLAVASAALQTELTARAEKAKTAARAYGKIARRTSGDGGGGPPSGSAGAASDAISAAASPAVAA